MLHQTSQMKCKMYKHVLKVLHVHFFIFLSRILFYSYPFYFKSPCPFSFPTLQIFSFSYEREIQLFIAICPIQLIFAYSSTQLTIWISHPGSRRRERDQRRGHEVILLPHTAVNQPHHCYHMSYSFIYAFLLSFCSFSKYLLSIYHMSDQSREEYKVPVCQEICYRETEEQYLEREMNAEH